MTATTLLIQHNFIRSMQVNSEQLRRASKSQVRAYELFCLSWLWMGSVSPRTVAVLWEEGNKKEKKIIGRDQGTLDGEKVDDGVLNVITKYLKFKTRKSWCRRQRLSDPGEAVNIVHLSCAENKCSTAHEEVGIVK
jgi:hypothetical protein